MIREHTHPPGGICPGCLDTARDRIRELEAALARKFPEAWKQEWKLRAEKAEAELAGERELRQGEAFENDALKARAEKAEAERDEASRLYAAEAKGRIHAEADLAGLDELRQGEALENDALKARVAVLESIQLRFTTHLVDAHGMTLPEAYEIEEGGGRESGPEKQLHAKSGKLGVTPDPDSAAANPAAPKDLTAFKAAMLFKAIQRKHENEGPDERTEDCQ